MKILFILHLPPPVHGSSMMGEYIKNSYKINNQVCGRYLNLSTSNSIDDIGKGGVGKVFRYLKLLSRVFWNLLVWKPDLCYLTPSSYLVGMAKDSLIIALIRLFKVKHVFHFHNKGVIKHSQTRVGKYLYPFVFHKAMVVLLSPLLYSDVDAYVPKDRVSFCANGIPDIGLQNKINNFSNKDSIRLLFLSNLIKSKGIFDLLIACKLLKETSVSYNCIIAGGEGDVSVNELQKSIADLGLQKQVFYIGKVVGTEKMELFLNSDLFVHPTHEDCFPLVLLEAMQVGIPIIATKEGAIPEIVQDGINGILVDAKNPQALAGFIKELSSNSEQMNKMGLANREKFVREYIYERFEERLLQILSQVVAKN